MLPVSPGTDADFAVELEDDVLSPLFRAGSRVLMKRSADLLNGDVGLFYSTAGIVFRQFCQDSEGNIYLFALNREHKDEDLMIPASGEKPVCYGKVILDQLLPLPSD